MKDVKFHPVTEEAPWVQKTLIAIAISFVFLILIVPLITIFGGALSEGLAYYGQSLADPFTISAVKLTLITAFVSICANVLFGLSASWCIAKFEFVGKKFLLALIDLPFTVSPVISGLVFVLLFGAHGFFGQWLMEHNINIIFAKPGIILATIFVTFPYVARELIPLMQAHGTDEEEAALTLGANGWQTFKDVTLPNIRWGLLFGVILLNARAMGEFGAVSVVSGHIRGETNTLPLHIEILYNEYNMAGAFSVATTLTLLALVTLIVKTYAKWKTSQDLD